jgi:hypothetical protein
MRLTRVLGVVGVALVAALAVPVVAAADQTVSTLQDENAVFDEFGCSDTGAYGQLVTVPAGEDTLTSFSFRIAVEQPPGNALVFRAMVFLWDAGNVRATGSPLFVSAPITYSSTTETTVTFPTGGVAVVAGQEYVLMTQADCGATPNALTAWGAVNPATYNEDLVFQNNGGDASQLTSTAWEQRPLNFAFEAVFSSPHREHHEENDHETTTTTAPPAPVAVAVEPRFTG